jgi:hypothetical protein
MEHDGRKSRYFGNLSLFMFSMLGIVLANNFVMMFIFWELVGVSSYLLIGHWFTRESAADAANKAFITNRIGDFGFMLGILMIWAWAGTVVFPGDRRLHSHGEYHPKSPYCCGAVDLLRCRWKECAIPSPRLVARCNGRPNTGVCADPCCDHGGGGRLHARARVLPYRT